jgi:dihydrofolate reductase
MTGKVVVNRAVSLDGFIGGPEHSMDPNVWPRVTEYVPSDLIATVAAATGAMLIGRRTWDVGDKLEADEPGSVDYPFMGPMYLLTHRPLERPDPDVTILSGDIDAAVATALEGAAGKDLEILGANVAGQCLNRGLVDELLVYVLPVLVGTGIPMSPPGLARVDLEPLSSTQAGAVTVLRYRVRKKPPRS